MLQPSHKTKLERAILWLEKLLEDEEKMESAYQEFFEENPIVFEVLGYVEFYTFTKESGRALPRDPHTDLRPAPDFLAKKDNGLFEIFEIKTPVSKKLMVESNRYREKFTAEVNTYVSQTITYGSYFTPNNRQQVNDLYDIDIQGDLDIKLVIGLNEHIDRAKVHHQARQYKANIDIVTYDEILSVLQTEYRRIYSDYENLPGFSLHFVIRFKSGAPGNRKYFVDIGKSPRKNRISVYLDKDEDLCFKIRDERGTSYDLRADIEKIELLDEWFYLLCEFGKSQDGFVMLMSIDGVERDERVKDTSVDLYVPFKDMMLGCDMNRQNFGHFDVAEKVIYEQTLTFRDKYEFLFYFADKYGDHVEQYIEFSGRQFMYRNNSGDLIQEVEEMKPTYRVID